MKPKTPIRPRAGRQLTAITISLRLGLIPLLVVLFGLGPVLARPQGQAYTTRDCIDCHNLKTGSSKLRIDTDGWSTSVHAAGFQCAECHTGVTSDYHISKIGSGAVDCLQCHQKRKEHGGIAAGADRPDCVQCHRRHRIYDRSNPASSLYQDNLNQTCGQCHSAETKQTGFFAGLTAVRIESHNKADLHTDYSMNNCLGCHQGHGAHGEDKVIEPASCPTCHMDENGQSALLGYMHPKPDATEQPGVFAAAIAYQLLAALILWLGFVWIIRRLKKR